MQKDSKIQISFIIPVHNGEKTLDRCLTSILDATDHEQVEILTVLNGCEDQSEQIVQKYAQANSCVRLIHSQKGVSKARNAGIDAAQGTWIFFLDADDWLTEGALACLLKDASSADSDLFIYSYEKGKEKLSLAENGRAVHESAQVDRCRAEMIANPTRCMAVWSKLFRKRLIEERKLRFIEELSFAEDSDFLIRYTKHCKQIVFCPEYLYHYAVSGVSTMRSWDGKKAFEYLKSLRETKKTIDAHESVQVKNAFRSYVLMHLNIIMVREVFCMENPESLGQKCRRMKQLVQEDIFRDAVVKTKVSACKSARMLPILMIKLKWWLSAGMIYLLRAKHNRKLSDK